MDRIGTAMGAITIPMALLTVLSALAGLWLLVAGPVPLVAGGIVALVAGFGLAWIVDYGIERLEDAAMAIRRLCGAALGQAAALVCGVVPMLVVLAWEYASVDRLARHGLPAGPPIATSLAAWLWSYGVATAPWTIHALVVGSDRRTLCGIRAYAGHIAYWLLAIAVAFGVHPAAAIGVMALPAILPVTVGSLLAVADREALRNVRI